MLTIGSETMSLIKPHETVVVRGGGGYVQNVPWNVPGFGSSMSAHTQLMGNDDPMFGAFGLTEDDKQKLAERIRAAVFVSDVQAILEVIPTLAERQDVAARALAIGANAADVQKALDNIERGVGLKALFKPLPMPARIIWGVLSTASFAASVYHGYKRNDSIGWAIWWGLMGGLFPVITPTIALAQGFAKPKVRRAGFGRAKLRATSRRRRERTRGMNGESTQYPFVGMYRGKRCEVYAATSYEAQKLAAAIFKAKRTYDVTVMRADITHTPTE
jgi:hypothetical protein